MNASYCLVFGEAYDDAACVNCSQPVLSEDELPRYVYVGRLHRGRLCSRCSEASDLPADLADALDALDRYVLFSATDPHRAAAAGLSVQQSLRHLLDERWLPLALGIDA